VRLRRQRWVERPDLVHEPADRLDSLPEPSAALGRIDGQGGDEHEGNPGNVNDPATHRTEGTRLPRRRRCGGRLGLVGDPAGRFDSGLEPTAALGCVDEHEGSDQQGDPGNERDRGTHTQVIGASETCPERPPYARRRVRRQLQLKPLTPRGRQEDHRHERGAGLSKVIHDLDNADRACADVLKESGDRLTVHEWQWSAKRPVLRRVATNVTTYPSRAVEILRLPSMISRADTRRSSARPLPLRRFRATSTGKASERVVGRPTGAWVDLERDSRLP
jgi:hypothetical protein